MPAYSVILVVSFMAYLERTISKTRANEPSRPTGTGSAPLRTSPGETGDKEAGAELPHLDEREQIQAAEHAAPAALVIYEVVREEGELELRRRNVALLWSGLAAGLSMGFSLLTLALIRAGLPDEPWRHLIDSLGYCVGFVIAILGRQQLFTESTLTAGPAFDGPARSRHAGSATAHVGHCSCRQSCGHDRFRRSDFSNASF